MITFSKVVEGDGEIKERGGIEGKLEFDKMANISAGKFIYGDDKQKKEIEHPFSIDIYPVTNGQYKEFIGEGGYSDRKILEECWSDEGRRWRVKSKTTTPAFWNDEMWNQSDCPVVGVSHYEAEAYAKWVGNRLPTEEEWEKAARGTDGNIYPWGNNFDGEKCNTIESGIKKTTPVYRYPNGISPNGCYDMAGNVWEWTSSYYDNNKMSFVLRGGSWLINSYVCRCAYRNSIGPDVRYDFVGFRCARTLTL